MNQTQSLSQAYDSAGVPLAQREAVTAMAAARRVAYGLALPVAPVGDACVYWQETLKKEAEVALSAINEQNVLDFDFALKAVELFWVARYAVLHEPESPEAMAAVVALVESKLSASSESLALASLESISGERGHGFSSLDPIFAKLWGSDSKGG